MPAKKTAPAGDGSKPLDPKREAFIANLLNGDSAAEAYRKVFPKAKMESAETAGPAMRREIQVGVRFDWFQRQVAERVVDDKVMSVEFKRNYLRRIVETPVGEIGEDSDLCQKFKRSRRRVGGGEDAEEWETDEIWLPGKLDAIKVDNEMAGHNKPQQIEVSGGLTIRDAIKELTHGPGGAAT